MVLSDADVAPWRALFPSTKHGTHLDHALMSPSNLRVVEAMHGFIQDLLLHGAAHEDAWLQRCAEVRAMGARLLGGSPTEASLVRNTSHGLSLVAAGLDWAAGDEVLLAAADEYPSNVLAWTQVAASRGAVVKDVPTQNGQVTVDALERAWTPRTRLLAVSAVQFSTGEVMDLRALGQWCQSRRVLMCVDGIQALGVVPLNVKDMGIHVLAAGGHKWLLGPPGAGFLHVDEALRERIQPTLMGWGNTANAHTGVAAPVLHPDGRRFEEGNAAFAEVHGLGAAVALLLDVGLSQVAARVTALTTALQGGLRKRGFHVSPQGTPAGIVSVTHPSASSGSRHATLTTHGVRRSVRRGRLRLAPHFYNTHAELERVVDLLGA
jgi:cysteine desulfurase/selenocysteine lyase